VNISSVVTHLDQPASFVYVIPAKIENEAFLFSLYIVQESICKLPIIHFLHLVGLALINSSFIYLL